MNKAFYRIIIILLLTLFLINAIGQNETQIFQNTDAPYVEQNYCSPFVMASNGGMETTFYYTVNDPYSIDMKNNTEEYLKRDLQFDITTKEPIVTCALYNEADNLVKTFFDNIQKAVGRYYLEWDGTDNNGDIVKDGAYYFLITTGDDLGNINTSKTPVIKNIIGCNISSPEANAILRNGKVQITGTAIDFFNFSYFTLAFSEGAVSVVDEELEETDTEFNQDESMTWHTIPIAQYNVSTTLDEKSLVQVQNGIMANWDTYNLKNSNYTLRLEVVSKQGKVRKFFRNITLSNPLYLKNVRFTSNEQAIQQTTPIFTPDGDDFSDAIFLFFDITKNADVSLIVKNDKSEIVYQTNYGTLNTSLAENEIYQSHKISWTGSSNTGNLSKSGVYTLKLRAENQGIIRTNILKCFLKEGVPSSDLSGTIVSPAENENVLSKTGYFFRYKAIGEGEKTLQQKVKIRITVDGIFEKSTVYFPVQGGPYYYDRVKEYPYDWTGEREEEPFFFTDSKGKEVVFDTKPTCDFSQPGVNQGSGFHTIGSTKGELTIFYENATELKNITKTIDGDTASYTTEPLMFKDVDIIDVNVQQNSFSMNLFTDPLRISFTKPSLFSEDIQYQASWGPKAKVWYYCNARRTFWGTEVYHNEIELIAIASGKEGDFKLYTEEGKDVSLQDLTSLLNLPDYIIDNHFKMQIIGIADSVDSDVFHTVPSNDSFVNLYFSSKGASSSSKNQTELKFDTITGISLKKEAWSTSDDKTLQNGFFVSQGYVFSGNENILTVPINYAIPEGVNIDKWDISLLNGEYKENQNLKILSINSNFFTITTNTANLAGKVIPILGSITGENIEYYTLSYINKTGSGLIEQKKIDQNIANQILGYWDVSSLAEGDYNLVLNVFSSTGNATQDIKKITYVIPYETSLSVSKDTNHPFSPDYEDVGIDFLINKDSYITFFAKNTNNDIVYNFLSATLKSNGQYHFEWNGRDENGTICSDGIYSIELHCQSVAKKDDGTPVNSTNITKKIKIQFVNKPIFATLDLTNPYFSPDGNGILDTLKIKYHISEKANVTISLLDESNHLLSFISPLTEQEIGDYEKIWNGELSSGNIISTGKYKIQLAVTSFDNPQDNINLTNNFNVYITSSSSEVAITSPYDGEILSSTPGIYYTYTAIAYGNYYPDVPINYTIKKHGVTHYHEYGGNNSASFNETKEGGIFGFSFERKRSVYRSSSLYNLYTYGYNTTASKENCYPHDFRIYDDRVVFSVHMGADSWKDGQWAGTVYVYGRRTLPSAWEREESGSIVVNNHLQSVLENQPNSNPNYIANKINDSITGYDYVLSSPNFSDLSEVIEDTAYQSGSHGGFKIKSLFYIPWNTGEGTPFVKKFNSILFDPSKETVSHSHDLFEELNYTPPANVEITGWVVQIESPNGVVNIATEDINPDGEISSSGIFTAQLNTDIEKSYIPIKGKVSQNMKNYTLYYYEGTDTTGEVTLIYDSSTRPNSDILAQWDVTHLFGTYTILLKVENVDGLVTEAKQIVKLGNIVTREDGGLVVSPYKRAEVNVPPLAIPADREDDIPSTPNKLDVIMDVVPSAHNLNTDNPDKEIITPVYEMLPHGIHFDSPVILKYHYEESQLPINGDESRLAIYHVKSDGTVEYLPGYIDKANNQIVVQITEFSPYTIVYDHTIVSTPSLINPVLLTKDNNITLNGTAKEATILNYTLNNTLNGTTKINNDQFSIVNVKLQEGTNYIQLQSVNQFSIHSAKITNIIILDSISPDFQVFEKSNDFISHFSPNNDNVMDTCNIPFSMNEDGKVSCTVSGADGNIILNKDIFVKANEKTSFQWNGIVNNQLLQEGKYSLVLLGSDNAGNYSLFTPSHYIDFYLDTTLPQIKNFSLSTNLFSSRQGEILFYFYLQDNISDQFIVTAEIYNDKFELIHTISDKQYLSSGNHTLFWNGKQNDKIVPDGNYSTKLSVFDLAGNHLEKNLSFTLDSTLQMNEADISVVNSVFSPLKNKFVISFPVNEECSVRYDISSITGTTLFHGFASAQDFVSLSWNGRDDSNVIVDDGTYQAHLIVSDKAGNIFTKDFNVTVDSISPICLLQSPNPSDTVQGVVPFIGTVSDKNFDFYKIFIGTNSTDFFIQKKLYAPVNQSELFSYDTTKYSNALFYKITVCDKASNISIITGSLIVDNPVNNFLSLHIVGSSTIDSQQKLTLTYNLTKTITNIKINIANLDNTIVSHLINTNLTIPQGEYFYQFNNSSLADGKYNLIMTAVSSNGFTNTKQVFFSIDKTEPQLNITTPIANQYIHGTVPIKGNLIENNLASYVLEFGYGANPKTFLLLNESHFFDDSTGIFGYINTRNLYNSIYQIRITAYDTLNHKTVKQVQCIIDNKLPVINITSPISNATYFQDSIAVSGSILDENLNQIQISYYSNNTPNNIHAFSVSDEPITNKQICSINTTGLNGSYILLIKANDKAGNAVQKVIPFNVDKDLPVAHIMSPSNNSIQKGICNIIGSSYSPNFNKTKLDYEYNNTTLQLCENNFPVSNASLYIWNTAGLNGLVTLKLSTYNTMNDFVTNSVKFFIDNMSPSVEIIGPDDNIVTKGNVPFTIKCADNHQLQTLKLSCPCHLEIQEKSLFLSGNNKTVYVFMDFGNINGECQVQAKLIDKAGNIDYAYKSLILDNTLPIIKDFNAYPQTFHPNSPVKNTVISFNISEPAYVYLTVRDSLGNEIKKISDGSFFKQGTIAENWDGRDENNQIVLEGEYQIIAKLVDTVGNESQEQIITVNVAGDIIPPTISSVFCEPSFFSPDNNSDYDTTTIHYTLDDNISERLTVDMFILNDAGNPVVTLLDNTLKNRGQQEQIWNGKINATQFAPEGRYSVLLQVQDGSGLLTALNDTTSYVIIDVTKPVISNLNLSNQYFSPNNDGAKDYAGIDFNISDNLSAQLSSLSVEVYSSNNCLKEVAQISNTNTGLFHIIWQGYDDSNSLLPDGKYNFKILTLDLAHNSISTDAPVYIDTTLPLINLVWSEPYYFSEIDNYVVLGENAQLSIETLDPVVNQSSSGINKIEYAIDNNWFVYSHPIAFELQNGFYSVFYKSSDKAGNETSEQFIRVAVDTEPPEITLNISDNAIYVENFNCQIFISDDFLQTNYVKINGDLLSPTNDMGVMKYSFPITNYGYYTVEVYARDVVGNESITNITFRKRNTVYVSKIRGDDNNSGTKELPFKKIQKGIDYGAEHNFDSVYIAEGVYKENIKLKGVMSLYGGWSDDFSIQDLSFSNYITRINGRDNKPNIEINSCIGYEHIIEGLKIKGGWTSKGRGLYITDSSNMIVRNSQIIQNESSMGAGIYAVNSSFIVSQCDIQNNDSSKGSALYSQFCNVSLISNKIKRNEVWSKGTVYAQDSTLIVRYNIISKNESGEGTGIWLKKSTANIGHNQIIDNNGWSRGGGVYVYSSSINIISNEIAKNEGSKGSGICIEKNSIGIIANNVITNNKGWAEGLGISINRSTIDIYDNIIAGHKNGSHGGGINVDRGIVNIKNNIIKDCEVWSSGGGIRLSRSEGLVANNEIKENYSEGSGGGISIENCNNLIVEANTIMSNKSDWNKGGGISTEDGSVVVRANVIIGNSANSAGTGINLERSESEVYNNLIFENGTDKHRNKWNAQSVVQLQNDNSKIINNTFFNNYEKNIEMQGSSRPVIANNIISGGDWGIVRWSGKLTGLYNNCFYNIKNDKYYYDVHKDETKETEEEINTMENSSDNRIANLDVLENGMQLQSNSICIDSGIVGTDYITELTNDIIGNHRPVGLEYDIGCVEYNGEVVQPALIIPQDLEDVIPPTTPLSVSPSVNEYVNNQTITFMWNPSFDDNGIDHYVIDIDNTSSAFANIEQTSVVYGTFIILDLTDGMKYWRVRAYDTAGNSSSYEMGYFTIDSVCKATITLHSPENDTIIFNATPDFSWTVNINNEQVTKYDIRIDDMLYHTSDLHFIFPISLDDGLHTWQVRAIDNADNVGQWSTLRRLTINSSGPSAPVLLIPADNSQTSDVTPSFSWQGLSKISQYEIVIDDVTNIVSDTTFAPLSALSSDVHKWEVRGIDGIGNKGNWSEEWKVFVNIEPFVLPVISVLYTPTNNSILNSSPFYSWSFESDVDMYRIDVNGQTNTVGSATNYTDILGDGFYTWRVQAHRLSGGWMGWSIPYSFMIDTIIPPTPILIQPEKNAQINDNFIIFKWDEVDDNSGIIGYEIVINGMTNQTTIPEFQLHNVSNGNYKWQVRAIDKAKNKGLWSEERTVSVRGQSSDDTGTKNTFKLKPNPMRNGKQLVIEYTADKGVDVQFELYTMMGRLVKVEKGRNGKAHWHGKNEAGHQVATGIYLILMKVDGDKVAGPVKLGYIR